MERVTGVPDAEKRSWLRAASLALCICNAAMPAASAISVRHDVDVQDYAALAQQPEYAAAGFYYEERFGLSCSCTLVAPDKVLTAAHCVQGLDPEKQMFATTPGIYDGTFVNNVSAIDVHPFYDLSSTNDLAVLTLSAPIENVTPARIRTGIRPGALATMIGYGGQGTGNSFPSRLSGAPDRMAAQNVIETVGSAIKSDFDSAAQDTNTYGSPIPIPLEGTTGYGDSGGPLFAMFNGRPFLVGVLSSGINPYGSESEYGDIANWVNLSRVANLSFLAEHGIVPYTPQPGDFNGDGAVDAADYTVWRDNLGGSFDLFGNGDEAGGSVGIVDMADYSLWKSNFDVSGAATETLTALQVPEPTSACLIFLLCVGPFTCVQVLHQPLQE